MLEMGKTRTERILQIERLLRCNTDELLKDVADTLEVDMKRVERELEYVRDRPMTEIQIQENDGAKNVGLTRRRFQGDRR